MTAITNKPPTMNLSNVPENFVPLTEHEFTKAYIAARTAAGDHWSTLDVVRSWAAYQHDPAGHFLSKPEVTTTGLIPV